MSIVTGVAMLLATVAQSAGVADLATRVRALGRELRIEQNEDVAIYRRALARGADKELDERLRDLTLGVLRAEPQITAAALKSRLQSAYDPWPPSEYTARMPEVLRLSLKGRPVMVVAWNTWLGGAGSPRSHAQVLAYTLGPSGWTLTGVTGEFLNDHGMFLNKVAARRPDELWFVLHGVRHGSSRVDVNVALVAFNGAGFRTRWSRDNLAQGSVQIEAQGLRLHFAEYAQAGGDFREVTEEWIFVPEGLERRSRKIAWHSFPRLQPSALAQRRAPTGFGNGDASCPAASFPSSQASWFWCRCCCNPCRQGAATALREPLAFGGMTPCAAKPDTAQQMFVPLAHLRYFDGAEILLNNNGVDPLVVRPMWFVRGADPVRGTRSDVPPLTMDLKQIGDLLPDGRADGADRRAPARVRGQADGAWRASGPAA